MSEDASTASSASQQQQQQQQQQHIRPKVRKTKDAKASSNKPASETPTTTNVPDTTLNNNAKDDVLLVEETRLRMEKWMGVGEKPLSPSAPDAAPFSTTSVVPTPASTSTAAAAVADVSTILETAERREERATTINTTKVETSERSSVGILKKTPKYSKKSSNSSSIQQQPSASSTPTTTTAIQNPIILSDLVVERDPARPLPPRLNIAGSGDNSISQHLQHAAVEGYVPRSVVAQGTTPSTASKPSKTKKVSIMKCTSPPTTTQAPPLASSSPAVLSDTVNNGSTTQNDEHKDKNDNPVDSPLILSSVADLFQAAGQSCLPEDDANVSVINEDTQLVEADISFSCMTQEQFKEQQERERQEQYQLFLGRQTIFKEEEDDEEEEKENELQNDTNGSERFDNPEEDEDEEEQDEEDGNEMESILQNGFDGHEEEDDYYEETGADSEENDALPEPRAFLKLWTTLSEWMTPQAVDWLNRLTASSSSSVISSEAAQSTATDWTPQVDRSDIGASRCAGLMAMIKMNLPNSLKELQQSHDIHRTAERRLADWLRTFDYSMPMAKLDLKLWRAMTCILLDIVLPPTTSSSSGAPALPPNLPASVVAVGMTREEYRYLTRSAVQSLGNTK